MANLKQMTIPDQVATVRSVWAVFSVSYQCEGDADTAVVETIGASLESGADTIDRDASARSNLGAIVSYVSKLLRAAQDGNKRAATFAAGDAIGTMARKLEQSDPDAARRIRNI